MVSANCAVRVIFVIQKLLMKHSLLLIVVCFVFSTAVAQNTPEEFHVVATEDFKISCDDFESHWRKANWISIKPDRPDDIRLTLVKSLYSKTGIYFLFFNEDRHPNATKKNDFDSLWVEDVAEVFLWPDTSMSVYFEYEISPLNRELVLIIPNFKMRFSGWIPWNYKGSKRVQHCVRTRKTVQNAEGAFGWFAQIFIPYETLHPMVAEIPKPGTVWRGNFYRADYDNNRTVEWSWKRTKGTFHEFDVFGRLVFD